VKAHLAIRVDPGPYGSVRISWAEQRQNPSAADRELGTVSDRLGDAAAARWRPWRHPHGRVVVRHFRISMTSLSVSLPQVTLLQPKISAEATAVPCLKVLPPSAWARMVIC
jgi:hypothetical protein